MRVAGEFFPKIDRFNKRRKNGNIPEKHPKKFWIHCASYGEYEMAVPIIEELIRENNLLDIIITTFSPSGYRQAIKGPYKDVVTYLPLDTQRRARKFYKRYTPEKAIFIRYDLWYNFIRKGLKRKVEFYLVNGRFTSDHFLLQWYGQPYVDLLKQFKSIFLSDNTSYANLKRLNFNNIQVSGDTRYDRVLLTVQENRSFPEIEAFKGDRPLLILGSSWQDEENLVFNLLQNNKRDIAVIIAPHDIVRSEEILKRFKVFNAKLYSEAAFSTRDTVLVLDTIGMLSALYKYADTALIGGGFTGKLHNTLEPAVWGCHVCFGPRIEKFPEAQDLIDAQVGCAIHSADEWEAKTLHILLSDGEKRQIKERAKIFTESHLGAAAKVLSVVQSA